MDELIRINADDEGFILDDISLYQGDMTLYHGKPFTGIKYAEYPNGQLRAEIFFKDGWPNRMDRRWYQNGLLEWQSNWKKGDQFAVEIEWHSNGMIKSVTHTEWRIQILSQEWDEDGNLTKHFLRDINYPLLQKERERNSPRNC